MANLFLAIFLIVFGVNIMFGLSLPPLVLGILALIPGVLLLVGRFGGRLPKP